MIRLDKTRRGMVSQELIYNKSLSAVVLGGFKWFLTISQAVEFRVTFRLAAYTHGSLPVHTATGRNSNWYRWQEVYMASDTVSNPALKC